MWECGLESKLNKDPHLTRYCGSRTSLITQHHVHSCGRLHCGCRLGGGFPARPARRRRPQGADSCPEKSLGGRVQAAHTRIFANCDAEEHVAPRAAVERNMRWCTAGRKPTSSVFGDLRAAQAGVAAARPAFLHYSKPLMRSTGLASANCTSTGTGSLGSRVHSDCIQRAVKQLQKNIGTWSIFVQLV